MTFVATTPSLVPFPESLAPAPPVHLTGMSRVVAPAGLQREAQCLANAIAARTGLELVVTDSADMTSGDIVFRLETDAPLSVEAYRIDTTDGVVEVTAFASAGAFWAAQTVRQLLSHDHDGWFITGARIADAPRYAYRGVMLDVARHFFGVDDVKRYIDAMSGYKYNVLHLHLTDDQGWRLQSESFPQLTEKASATAALGDRGGFYTQADYAEIVAYAASRHMTVVPEIDVPGHTHAVTVAYPEFTKPTAIMDSVTDTAKLFQQDLPIHGESYVGWCVGFSSLKIDDPATDAFVREIFREVAAATPGPYVHLGGDESLGTTDEDFAAFIAMASRAVAETGKTPIAWHEAGKAPGLAAGTIGQYWGYLQPQPGYDDEARAFVTNGGSLILSPADVSYLDMKPTADHPLGLIWANGPTSVESAYTWEPTDIISGVPASAIIGVEAPLWTESARTMDDVFTLAFPRAAAVAEIAWSPQDAPERTWDSFRARVASHASAWQSEGITFHNSEEISWIPA
ncbi:family 20 glycosylhydrolase [Microbacterium sp. NC79]|uniref:family 20 glycosylhydrolase n=1 Tax=Microbacterium sp. NC79 TaxID=2851009 RepID=UPI001C2BC736|nr:family 20 glycosylhydrolase [Microbacterium sp. NC79]MBV0894220.1 beta-N-acetylhexosaminidase [Microbacterium sp. NC79]